VKKLILFLILLSCLQSYGQQNRQRFTVLFYNLENLFDTINDPLKNDEDFLPGSEVSWNTARYFKKLDHIAEAVISADSINYPAIIGVAEAENKKVLQDLLLYTPLKNKNYDVVLEEGPDPRGIDVGLLYKKNMFTMIGKKGYRGADSFEGRYILYVKLKKEKDTLHIFVNHWKSRTGGAEETAPMRMESALKLKTLTDSLLSLNPSSEIIIMGDFNDEPADQSISAGLKAKAPERDAKKTSIYNLMYGVYSRGEGTLYYKDWDVFDQLMVSGILLKNGKGLKVLSDEGKVLQKPFLLFKNKQGVMVPNRTAGSKSYFGGYSDHLPVYMIMGY
jgi:hypothetical protein